MHLLRSIRFRVTVLATLTTAVLIFAFGVLLTRLVTADLIESGEDALAEVVEEVEGVSLVRLGEQGVEIRVEDEEVLAELDLDDDGDIVVDLFRDSDDGPADEPFGAFVLDTGTEEIREVIDLDGSTSQEELERISAEVAEDIVDGATDSLAGLDVVEASQQIVDGVTDGVDAAQDAAWRIGPLLVLLSAVVTWIVVGRALAPTRRIAAEAAAIDSTSLDRRMSRDGGGEVDTIARVINEMLERIEGGVRREQQFVSDASHELRTPLATARIAAELAGTDDPDSIYPPQVVEEIDRMQQLVDDLLELARGDVGRPHELVPFGDLLREQAARHPQAHRIRVSVTHDGVIHGRPAELRRVMVNLLDNAERFAGAGVDVSAQVVGSEVVLHVDDDGPGIPPADRRRIFDRFTRLDEGRARAAGGSGLGLAIVHSIVSRHGGSVEVNDAPTGGARFTVRLPIAPDTDG